MSRITSIEWCDSTFSSWIGCTKISKACDHCYAERWGKRFGIAWGPGAPRKRTSEANWKQPLRWNRKAGADSLRAASILGDKKNSGEQAVAWARAYRRPRVFCNQLGDVFDNEVPEAWRCDLFDLIVKTPHLDWLVLTKRIGNAREMMTRYWTGQADGRSRTHMPSIWLGATICNRSEMLRDGPKLKDMACARDFWSVEPMLGDLGEIPRELMPRWVICGSESGPHSRRDQEMLAWVRSLRDQCKATGAQFFWKQDVIKGKKISTPDLDGRKWVEVPA